MYKARGEMSGLQNRFIEKEIEYFKIRDEAANNTQMVMGMGMIQP